MKITLWHYQLPNGDFRYSHWREGHQSLSKHPDRQCKWLGKHSTLDITKSIPVVKD
jgi:hypothetical protein